MKKRYMVVGCLGLILLITSCDKHSDILEHNSDSTAKGGTSGFYSNFTAGGGADDYALSGKAYVNDTLPCLYITSSENSEINMKGKLEEVSGNVEIIYVSDKSEKIIVSTEDKNTDIDINIQLESGDGRIEFRGSDVNLKFDLSIENIDRQKVEYLSAESKKEEEKIDDELPDIESLSDTNLETENQDEVLQEIMATYTDNDKNCVVLKTEIKEDTKLKISIKTSVSNTDDSKSMSFSGFELAYKTEEDEDIVVIKNDEAAFALGDYEWQDNFSEEVELPKGTNELIFRNNKGSNYKIALDICVTKVYIN